MGYNFKGLFIKEEENTETMKVEKPATTVKNIEPKVENVMPMVRPAVVETRTVNNGFVDKEIEAKIWDKIVSKNLPGPDYIEFKNVAAGLVDITPDESMQMRGAFNVLKRTYPTFTKEIITTITTATDRKEVMIAEDMETDPKEITATDLVTTETAAAIKEITTAVRTVTDLKEIMITEETDRKETTATDLNVISITEVAETSTDVAADLINVLNKKINNF